LTERAWLQLVRSSAPFTLIVALISGRERVAGCRCSEEYHEYRNGGSEEFQDEERQEEWE